MIRVLILDNDALFCQTLSKILHHHIDAIITLATTAEDAYSAVKHTPHTFDVFLIDLRLDAGQDGITVMQHLHLLSPGTGAVILSALDEREIQIRAYQAGADRFLSKPPNVDELIALVHSLSARRQGAVSGLGRELGL